MSVARAWTSTCRARAKPTRRARVGLVIRFSDRIGPKLRAAHDRQEPASKCALLLSLRRYERTQVLQRRPNHLKRLIALVAHRAFITTYVSVILPKRQSSDSARNR